MWFAECSNLYQDCLEKEISIISKLKPENSPILLTKPTTFLGKISKYILQEISMK